MKPEPGSGESGGVRRLIGHIRQRVSALPRGLLVALATGAGVIAIAATVAMYRAYTFIQHDNEFCNSCHLMAEAFGKFNESAHRGLGCKACHRPNIIQRAQMGLVAIIENPTEVGPHAPVPNERCASCHVDGNPEEWKLISNSVGHRVHLESNDPALQGLRCITCHAKTIHEFAAAAETCAQSGCHEQTDIQLGRMSNLAIHCAACHDFSRPVVSAVAADSLKHQLLPRRPECLSCHAMRQRVRQMPDDEPHGSVCGTCHNPHEQTTPESAVLTCASGSCHERIDTVSPFHRGLDTGVLEKCTSCHGAHDWKVKSTECQACHTPESLDSGTRRIAPSPHQSLGTMSAGAFDLMLLPYRMLAAVLQQQIQWPAPPADRTGRFSHRLHRNVTCTSCHTAEDAHGAIKIRTATDCAGCHHSTANRQRCTSCHGREELSGARERTVAVKLTVWPSARPRTLTFAHSRHANVDCVSCHQGAPSFTALKSCADCHSTHHDADRSCVSCHDQPAESKAHDRRVHLTCEGAGCHTSALLPRPVTARNVCVACHRAQVDHEPGGDCASCHLIPKRRVSTAERKP